MMIYGCPSHRHSSSSLYSSFLITLLMTSVCGHVTGVVTCHSSAWQFITRSHSHADVESCVDVGIVMIGPHKVPRDLLPRSSVSNLLSKLQSKKILKLNSMEVEEKNTKNDKKSAGNNLFVPPVSFKPKYSELLTRKRIISRFKNNKLKIFSINRYI